jgi:hypothetical protein
MLATLARSAGAVPRIYPLVPDTSEATEQALFNALRDCDVVVSSGGVSGGEFDVVKESFQGLGGRLDFWQVSLRPGKRFGGFAGPNQPGCRHLGRRDSPRGLVQRSQLETKSGISGLDGCGAGHRPLPV